METVEIAKAFVAATANILSTMANINPTAGNVFVKKDRDALGDFSAIIGVTGKYRGSICVTFSREGAILVAKGMLGDDLGDIEQDIADTVGEIANMVSGQARATIAQKGVTLHGSTPTIVVGENHRVTHLSKSPVMCIPFTMPKGSFTVEFCLE
ncbi:MAG: chemotaxis protein CheX [Deltaproteobacteria bacterium]|jgi:chemotaxis protein CheX|nr:chemotaxis protein CheX [Deltaproteobacteria bacterium]